MEWVEDVVERFERRLFHKLICSIINEIIKFNEMRLKQFSSHLGLVMTWDWIGLVVCSRTVLL